MDATTTPCLPASFDITSKSYVYEIQGTSEGWNFAHTPYAVNAPSSHPVRFEGLGCNPTMYGANNVTDSDGLEWFYGNFVVDFNGCTSTISLKCLYHGYMGAEHRLSYDAACVHSSPFLPAPLVPVTSPPPLLPHNCSTRPRSLRHLLRRSRRFLCRHLLATRRTFCDSSSGYLEGYETAVAAETRTTKSFYGQDTFPRGSAPPIWLCTPFPPRRPGAAGAHGEVRRRSRALHTVPAAERPPSPSPLSSPPAPEPGAAADLGLCTPFPPPAPPAAGATGKCAADDLGLCAPFPPPSCRRRRRRRPHRRRRPRGSARRRSRALRAVPPRAPWAPAPGAVRRRRSGLRAPFPPPSYPPSPPSPPHRRRRPRGSAPPPIPGSAPFPPRRPGAAGAHGAVRRRRSGLCAPFPPPSYPPSPPSPPPPPPAPTGSAPAADPGLCTPFPPPCPRRRRRPRGSAPPPISGPARRSRPGAPGAAGAHGAVRRRRSRALRAVPAAELPAVAAVAALIAAGAPGAHGAVRRRRSGSARCFRPPPPPPPAPRGGAPPPISGSARRSRRRATRRRRRRRSSPPALGAHGAVRCRRSRALHAASAPRAPIAAGATGQCAAADLGLCAPFPPRRRRRRRPWDSAPPPISGSARARPGRPRPRRRRRRNVATTTATRFQSFRTARKRSAATRVLFVRNQRQCVLLWSKWS